MSACATPALTISEDTEDFVMDRLTVQCVMCGWTQKVDRERIHRMKDLYSEEARGVRTFLVYLHMEAPAMPLLWEGDNA